MKRFLVILASLLIGFMSMATPALAAGTNLIANPSLETASGSLPQGWAEGNWGTNTAAFSYDSTAHTGVKGATIVMSGYSNGDAKWYPTPVSVTGGTTYNFSDWYKSTVTTNIDAVFTDTTGATSYMWLANPVAGTNWTQTSYTFTAPSNAKTLTIYHSISANGQLSIDDFSVTSGSAPAPAPAPAPVDTSTGVPNPSVETVNGSGPQAWSSSNWGTNTVTFSYLSTGHTGNHSLKTNVTAYTNGAADWSYDSQPVTPGGHYRYTDWYQSNVGTEIDGAITMQDGTTQYVYMGTVLPSTAWAQASAEYDIPAGAVRMTVFHLVAAKGTLVTDDFAFAPYVPAPFTRGLVSVTFDDGWTNQYTNAYPLLSKYNLPATFYIISGELTDQPDYMSRTQVKTLYGKGHEIASHTITHPDLTTVGATRLKKEMNQSQATLQTLIGSPVTDFAYPYGAYNATTISVGKQYYVSQRSVASGYNTKDNLDLTQLKVQNIYNTTTPAQVAAWVNQANAQHTWLILVYHEVSTTPTDPTDVQYNTQPADLNSELAYIKQSGIGIVTVKQAIAEVQPQIGH